MADYVPRQNETVPNTMRTRYRDMGDGTHAEVHYLGGGTVGVVDSSNDRAGVDGVVNALQVIDVLHHEIHEGETFYVSYKSADGTPIADDGTVVFTLTIGAKTCHTTFAAVGGGDAEVAVYEGSTVTGGTATTAYNRDRTSTSTTTVGIVRDPTVNTAGTLIDNQFIPGGSGPQAAGGMVGPRNEWILKPGLKYTFRLTNRAGTVQPMSLLVEWYEED